jgi:hypothetical protein
MKRFGYEMDDLKDELQMYKHDLSDYDDDCCCDDECCYPECYGDD